MNLINEKILSDFKKWLTSYNNPKYTGEQKFEQYGYYLERLLNKALELGLIRKDDIKFDDINWVNSLLKLRLNNRVLAEFDEKRIGHNGGRASLYRYIDFLTYQNNKHKVTVSTPDLKSVLIFMNDYAGTRYSSDMLTVGELGKSARNTMIELASVVKGQVPNLPIASCSQWQNSGNIYNYLWLQLKNESVAHSPFSISIRVVKDGDGKYSFKVYTEICDKKANQYEFEIFNKGILYGNYDKIDGAYYLGKTHNDSYIYFGHDIEKAQQEFLTKKYSKVTINIDINTSKQLDVDNAQILSEILNAIKSLLPVYYAILNSKADVNKVDTFNEEQAMSSKNMFDKNLILYGPPGTGKTYNTVYYAVAMIEERSMESIKREAFDEVLKRYHEYRANGQIEFVTFHQSFGYEEFIEGIKPKTDENGSIAYSVEPGIFKRFCKRAEKPIIIDDLANDKIKSINDNPTIWKVSLMRTGDNPIRSDCLDNGHIRVAYDSYGEEIPDDGVFSEGGKNVLNAFINKMKIGDIVFSCYSATHIDAIGIVSSEYKWVESYAQYKRVRDVEWIYKGSCNILDINDNQTMIQSTVYQLTNVTMEDVYKIIRSGNKEVKIEPNKNKYVFIVDEINRGNISQIFGETITLLEETKRKGAKEAVEIRLPYSQEYFSVPNNVYILGTMNTADRSIQSMDIALRRRFSFKELMPNPEVLHDIYVDDISIESLLTRINERIEYLYDREHTIGHSYFLKLKEDNSIQKLGEIMSCKIIPLLQEYFYDDYEKIMLVLGDNQKSNRDEMFLYELNGNIENSLFGKTLDENKAVYIINKDAFCNVVAYKHLV